MEAGGGKRSNLLKRFLYAVDQHERGRRQKNAGAFGDRVSAGQIGRELIIARGQLGVGDASNQNSRYEADP